MKSCLTDAGKLTHFQITFSLEKSDILGDVAIFGSAKNDKN